MQTCNNPYARQVRPDVTLSNGRLVTYALMDNGAQEASMLDGGPMSEEEWKELCRVFVRSVSANA
jgi:hypothetical protein